MAAASSGRTSCARVVAALEQGRIGFTHLALLASTAEEVAGSPTAA